VYKRQAFRDAAALRGEGLVQTPGRVVFVAAGLPLVLKGTPP